MSRKLESNQRPTDYKSVALPTELFRLIQRGSAFLCASTGFCNRKDNKELPPNFGKAKVREFDNWKNFESIFFACSQPVVNKMIETVLSILKCPYQASNSGTFRNRNHHHLNSFFLRRLSSDRLRMDNAPIHRYVLIHGRQE